MRGILPPSLLARHAADPRRHVVWYPNHRAWAEAAVEEASLAAVVRTVAEWEAESLVGTLAALAVVADLVAWGGLEGGLRVAGGQEAAGQAAG